MESIAHAVAKNLREERNRQGISLSELARRSGISKATLSALEHGRGNPSIDTLWSLAQALNMPFGAFFADDSPEQLEVRNLDDCPVVTSAPGFVGRKVIRQEGKGGFELYVLDLEGGAKRDAAPHLPGVMEHVIVLKGRVDVGPDSASTELKAGECASFSADTAHHYRALSPKVRLLSLTDYP
jgi:transcriptional regulator with XRE-family HTH domain